MSLKAWRRGFTENIKTARARPKAATESLLRCEVRAAGGQSLWRNLWTGIYPSIRLSIRVVHRSSESGTDTYTYRFYLYPSAYFLPPFTAALSVAPALNAGTLEAPIFSSSPVLGLRPVRAARLRASKVPKPTNEMESPVFRVSEMISSIAPRPRSASALLQPVLVANSSTSSFLFMPGFPMVVVNKTEALLIVVDNPFLHGRARNT